MLAERAGRLLKRTVMELGGFNPMIILTEKANGERENHHMSTNLTAVLQELLQNTSNLKVLRQLMTPDATYVSLSLLRHCRLVQNRGRHTVPQRSLGQRV
jgi:hypothetical protein